MQNEWFEDWFNSPYYHLLYKNRSSVEASDFVEKIVQFLNPGPDDTLLDIACGKGRHAKAFSQYHLDVTGIDLSRESIAYARQLEHDKLHFFVHDMRNIFRTNYFHYVCNLFTSFGYFKKSHDNVLAAKAVHAALKKEGKFLIDFVNKNHAIRNIEQNRNETIVKNEIEFVIERTFTENQFIKKIHITDGDKKLHFQESVNSFSLDQMTSLFQSAGLQLIGQFGNYELHHYDELNSPRMILIFQK